MKLSLYHYWRSTSSWRVRWALNIKNLECNFIAVNLLKDEQNTESYLKKNPMGLIPLLEVNDGKKHYLAESTAIIEWLDEVKPTPPLVFGDAYQKARIRQLAQIINAGTHPLQNLRTQKFYSEDQQQKLKWAQHWIRQGLAAYEKLVQETAGIFSVGDELSMADLCLIPQGYNAYRYEVGLEDYPTVKKIYDAGLATAGCQKAHPDRFKPAN